MNKIRIGARVNLIGILNIGQPKLVLRSILKIVGAKARFSKQIAHKTSNGKSIQIFSSKEIPNYFIARDGLWFRVICLHRLIGIQKFVNFICNVAEFAENIITRTILCSKPTVNSHVLLIRLANKRFVVLPNKFWNTITSTDVSTEHTSELQSPDHLVCRLL